MLKKTLIVLMMGINLAGAMEKESHVLDRVPLILSLQRTERLTYIREADQKRLSCEKEELQSYRDAAVKRIATFAQDEQELVTLKATLEEKREYAKQHAIAQHAKIKVRLDALADVFAQNVTKPGPDEAKIYFKLQVLLFLVDHSQVHFEKMVRSLAESCEVDYTTMLSNPAFVEIDPLVSLAQPKSAKRLDDEINILSSRLFSKQAVFDVLKPKFDEYQKNASKCERILKQISLATKKSQQRSSQQQSQSKGTGDQGQSKGHQ